VATCLLVAYDGTAFHGAARQPGVATIVGSLEEALRLRRVPFESLAVAGRTDAGVHARAQVVSGLPALDGRELERLAGMLPRALWLRAACQVEESFDARRGARWRSYVYRVRRAPRDPLAERAWSLAVPLALRPMREVAAALCEVGDFSALCKSSAAGGYRRRLHAVELVERPGWLEVVVVGESFCHQMVRRIVGMLVEVGRGRLLPAEAVARVRHGDRTRLAFLAPPQGLFLWQVGYRPEWGEALSSYRAHGFEHEWARIDRRELPGPLEWWAECQSE
jgi:tRNA pseudouridine38-40 synthase